MNRQQQLDRFSLALHRKAIETLRHEPALRCRATETLARWRAAGSTRSDPLWVEWERLLAADFAMLEQAALAESEHATLMRSVSPLGGLVAPQERQALLKQARHPSATP